MIDFQRCKTYQQMFFLKKNPLFFTKKSIFLSFLSFSFLLNVSAGRLEKLIGCIIMRQIKLKLNKSRICKKEINANLFDLIDGNLWNDYVNKGGRSGGAGCARLRT